MLTCLEERRFNMPKLEYQFEIEIFKREKISIKTERMSYDTALNLSDKLGKKGIHYHIKEIFLTDNFQRQITSKMLRMPIRKKWYILN
jgi:hypothetical protein